MDAKKVGHHDHILGVVEHELFDGGVAPAKLIGELAGNLRV
jgi:hypothetical protein